jgi:hypothetical protein
MIISKYSNLKLVNYLKNLNKNDIFKFGTGGGKQISGLYRLFNSENDKHFIDLIDYNQHIFKQNNLNITNNIFLEQREYHFNKNDEPFEGLFHMDLNDETQKQCYTCIYYYHICPSIKGGELIFKINEKTNTEKIFIPKENDLICFDGNIKHKINKIYGSGIRGILIMNFDKSL